MNTSTPRVPKQSIRFTTALRVCAVGFLALASVVGAAVAPRASYVVQDLGVLSGDATSGAWGVNASGDVVGWSTGKQGSRAFVYTDKAGMIALPSLIQSTSGSSSFARDINDYGEIVGTSGLTKDGQGRAVVWSQGRVFDLGTLRGGDSSEGWAINNNGQIVGSSQVGDLLGSEHAFLYSKASGMIDLTPNNEQAAALDINDAGSITGYFTSTDNALHAFLNEGNKMVDLGKLAGFDYSTGTALNEMGVVVGTATSPERTTAHMFRSDFPGEMDDLNGKLPIAFALGVNIKRQIVGYMSGVGTTRAILYTETTGVRDLNSLISPRGGWVLEAATDINDSGVIVGYAYNALSKTSHAVRLRPVPVLTPAPTPKPTPTSTLR
jgi:probable HAF family extracellular repeat protein